MKSLTDSINENLLPKDERELKKLGFKKEVEGKEIWFQMTYKKNLIRIMQEEVGDNGWWMAKIESYFVLNADNYPCKYETPLEAAYDAIDTVDDWEGKKKMKSLYESILSKAGVGVVKKLSPHFEEIARKYDHHIIVEQVENFQGLNEPKKFPHDSKIFDIVRGNLEKKLPVSKKDILSEYKDLIWKQHSLRDSEFKKDIKMNVDEEGEFALLYIFYAFYKLESTNYWNLSQPARKAKIWTSILDDVNDEIGCGFMWRRSTSNYPDSGDEFTIDRNALSNYGKDDVVVKVKWTSFIH